MLTMTHNASAIVNEICAHEGLGEGAGLRISADEAPQANLELSTTTQAEPGDQLVEQAGAAVYLDEVAASVLADKVLDAVVDDTGRVEFRIDLQSPA